MKKKKLKKRIKELEAENSVLLKKNMELLDCDIQSLCNRLLELERQPPLPSLRDFYPLKNWKNKQ